MIYLLDINVISETVKKPPDSHVFSWLKSVSMRYFSLSVLTLTEIRKGAEKIEDSSRKKTIIQWLEIDLVRQFMGRIIEINNKVSDKWGYINSQIKILAINGLIAASALMHNQKLVTRNVKDFKNVPGLEIINSWEI